MRDKAQVLRLKAVYSDPNSALRPARIKLVTNLSTSKSRIVLLSFLSKGSSESQHLPGLCEQKHSQQIQGSVCFFHSALKDHVQNTTWNFEVPNIRNTSISGRNFSGRPLVWPGVKHLPSEWKGRELGLLSLQKRVSVRPESSPPYPLV